MQTNSYQGYSTNVGFIKFIAAGMVILSHAFPLCLGNEDREWFHVITAGKLTMGSVAVGIFFFYSGLLVTKSLLKNGNGKNYFKNRIKRIFPPLWLVVVVSAFVLGPLVSTLPAAEYFTDAGTYSYLCNGILLLTHDLPGVFADNIYGATVNGALWTLPVEFLCYIGLFVVYKCKCLHKLPMKILTAAVMLVMLAIGILQSRLGLDTIGMVFFPVAMFWMGMFYYIFREEIPMRQSFGLAALGILAAADVLQGIVIGTDKANILWPVLLLVLPYLLAYAGFAARKLPQRAGDLGNFSYGMYLVGFPIQQTLVHLCGGTMNLYGNMIAAVLLALVCGVGIYYGVERRI